MKSETVHYLFQLVSVLFFVYFLYNIYSLSVVDAFLETLTMWATIVVATPIPSVSILLGFPLKLFLNISIHIIYLFIAGLSLFIIFHSDHNSVFVQHILDANMYSIFAISILSSTILTKLLDSGIDYVAERKPMHYTLPLVITSCLLLALYAYQIQLVGIKME